MRANIAPAKANPERLPHFAQLHEQLIKWHWRGAQVKKALVVRGLAAGFRRARDEFNLDTVLDAFIGDEELKSKAALVIVGDGPYLAELRERYAHPGIAFPGFMKGRDLARAYASADAFVFPSTTDTYGNSVLEAQASGLPSLVSDEGGPKEIIAPDRSGFVLPGHDVAAWRKAMRE
jgi:glycosyltransferase involved in cell wall biosynthesis